MLRKVKPEDRELFIGYSREFYNSEAVLYPIPEEHYSATFDELMRSEDYLLGYIITVENQDAGYLLLSKSFSQEAGGIVIWVEEIYIQAQFRRKGTGSEIFDFIDANIPHARVRLEVEADNLEALRLYKRKGFRELPYLQMIKGK